MFLIEKMAGRKVAGLILTIGGRNILTLLSCMRASGVEAATRWGICGGGNIAIQNDSVHLNVGVRIGNRREECFGVRMDGICEDILLVTKLNHRSPSRR